MAVGYLPDMFGHVAQMPQILRLAGLEHAVVWRGVPAASTRPRSGGRRPTARACAPSTSTARTPTAATSPTTRSSSSPARRGYEAELGDGRAPRRRHAADERHRPPAAAAVARASRRRGERACRTTTTSRSRRSPSTCATQPTDGLAHVERRAALGRARQRAHGRGVEPRRRAPGRAPRAERALERRAEPLTRAVPPADAVSRTRCSTSAWRKLVLNSAHDSSCACSADEVVDEVLVRYQEARQIGDGLARDAVRTPRRPTSTRRRRRPSW